MACASAAGSNSEHRHAQIDTCRPGNTLVPCASVAGSTLSVGTLSVTHAGLATPWYQTPGSLQNTTKVTLQTCCNRLRTLVTHHRGVSLAVTRYWQSHDGSYVGPLCFSMKLDPDYNIGPSQWNKIGKNRQKCGKHRWCMFWEGGVCLTICFSMKNIPN